MTSESEPRRPLDRSNLLADCSRCFGLCCVALPFAASADFAIDKEAGSPCINLQTDFRCGIHSALRGKGFRGCIVYDCFGAGQQVAQVTFGGRDWRSAPETARQMFDVFPVMRQLHELAWYLTEALTLVPDGPLQAQLAHALDEVEHAAQDTPERLLALDVKAHGSSCSSCGSANAPGPAAKTQRRRSRHRVQKSSRASQHERSVRNCGVRT